MHSVISSVIVAVLSLLGTGPNTGADRLEAPAVETPDVEIRNADEHQRSAVQKALATFGAARLELPPLVVVFADEDDRSLCDGNAGLFRHGSADTLATILICHKSSMVLRHELAHAYVHVHVGSADRDVYLAHLGITEWSDPSAGWNDRASERAANSIAFTLSLDVSQMTAEVRDVACDYGILTGTTHPNLLTAGCSTTA